MSSPTRAPFFEGLPERGVWTPLNLGRGQFLAILAFSVLLFVFVGGPLWSHLHDSHFVRIAVSYGVIPPAVGVALYRNRSWRFPLLLGGSVVIAIVKLVLTAGLTVLIALAR